MARLPRLLSASGRGGSRRPLLLAGVTVAALLGAVVIFTGHKVEIPKSRVAAAPPFNTLPGGTNSDAEQDRLAAETEREAAQRAAAQGRSYTPPIAAGRPTTPAELGDTGEGRPAPDTTRVNHTVVRADVPPPPRPVPTDPRFASPQFVRQVSADPKDIARYAMAIQNLEGNWGARAPRTVITAIETPSTSVEDRARPSGASHDAGVSSTLPLGGKQRGELLVPAGRGVFAHTVVSVDSDVGGPIVLQADSGPLAGDRLIGTFSKAGGHENLLVVQVNKVEHQGEEISSSGVVVAPQTMQTAVASSVDQHYFSRFVLPAAAAFVQGLGSALATTSNTYSNIGPLGNESYVTQLHFPQQLGVAAGTAAGVVGNALQQQAPTGPTIHLDANANVGVIFLSDVKTAAS